MTEFNSLEEARSYLGAKLALLGIIGRVSVDRQVKKIVNSIPQGVRHEYDPDDEIAAAEYFENWVVANGCKLEPEYNKNETKRESYVDVYMKSKLKEKELTGGANELSHFLRKDMISKLEYLNAEDLTELYEAVRLMIEPPTKFTIR